VGSANIKTLVEHYRILQYAQSKGNELMNVRALVSALLSRHDWVYLLSLLIPLVAYNLTLKVLTIRVAFEHAEFESRALKGFALTYLMGSEVFFSLGYVLFWIGLFVAAKRTPLRWAVVVLFHTVAILVVIVTTSAYQYFKQTGTTLDYGVIALYVPRVKEIMQYGLLNSVSLSAWAFLAFGIFYAALGPWVLTRFAGRWRGWPERSSSTGTPRAISFLVPLGLWLLALVFGTLSLQISSESIEYSDHRADDLRTQAMWRFSRSFMRGAFVNMAVTATETIGSEEFAGVAAEPPPPAKLLSTSGSERRNVVLIVLETSRAQSLTPYNEELGTTPFLDELARNSLLAERAYAIVPWSSKAEVAINCGIEPNLVQSTYGVVPEAGSSGIPTECLADLLKDQGYNTGFFMPTARAFEDFAGLVDNIGYEDFYSSESMDKEGFEEVNYPGGSSYEDDIMLEPSEQWLEKHKDKPFLATYHTTTPHHQYIVPKRYGEERFANDEELNRYLNTLRYQDFFLKNLFDQYKRLGLYEDTVFVILGDHGEGFGEHGRFAHGDTIYEEGLRIPLVIHDSKRLDNGVRLKEPVTQLDVLPTIADLLGYQIEGGAYQGTSLLRPLPGRTLMFSCWIDRRCLASLKGDKKYIYHHVNRPEEIFDLSKDPLEKQNLADESEEEIVERRSELLEWRSRIDAFYRAPQNEG
jgi:lipoteichoic acid synthase